MNWQREWGRLSSVRKAEDNTVESFKRKVKSKYEGRHRRPSYFTNCLLPINNYSLPTFNFLLLTFNYRIYT